LRNSSRPAGRRASAVHRSPPDLAESRVLTVSVSRDAPACARRTLERAAIRQRPLDAPKLRILSMSSVITYSMSADSSTNRRSGQQANNFSFDPQTRTAASEPA